MNDERVEGTVERITYANEESGFTVLKLLVKGRRDPLTVVGNCLGVQPGEFIAAHGRYKRNAEYGEQFHADGYRTERPNTVEGMRRYLGSGMVKGLGPTLAARITEKFGAETLELIDHSPERLKEVDGIGVIRCERIKKAWAEQRQIREVMVFLQSHQVSPLLAVRIFKRYGDLAIDTVRDNPYRLALDIFGIGFKTADKIAQSLGVDRASPQRLQAGLLHTLSELSDEGHVCAPVDALCARAGEMLEAAPEPLKDALAELSSLQLVVKEEGFGDEGPMIYLSSLHASESALASAVARRCQDAAARLSVDVSAAIAEFEQQQQMALAPQQREAVEAAGQAGLLVITGGPGTGKTTLVKAVLSLFDRAGLSVQLAAPTGRAAKRMSEATGREAKTVHRLLEWSPVEHRFTRDRDNPLEADALVLDEVSMVDVALGWSVFRAVKPSARIVLVGDVDQLPSVGPGSVLADLIESGAVPLVRLSQVFRQAEASDIVKTAHALNQGRPPKATKGKPETDFFFIERKEPEQILAMVKELLLERIPRRFGFDPRTDIQLLTPMQRGTLGAQALNAELQAALNPEGDELVRGARVYRTGDKVMQLRNNYDLGVFNGDVGLLGRIDREEQEVEVRFDDRVVRYPFSDVDELALAYAVTIHKSQGSEYPCVVVALHTQAYVMLARNLLYTAVTRGKKLVVLVGNERAARIAAESKKQLKRWTLLEERIRRLAVR